MSIIELQRPRVALLEQQIVRQRKSMARISSSTLGGFRHVCPYTRPNIDVPGLSHWWCRRDLSIACRRTFDGLGTSGALQHELSFFFGPHPIPQPRRMRRWSLKTDRPGHQTTMPLWIVFPQEHYWYTSLFVADPDSFPLLLLWRIRLREYLGIYIAPMPIWIGKGPSFRNPR